MNIYPIGYFPSIPWYTAAIQEESVLLEVSQYFRKQQITNRMHIRVANRVFPLTIPIKRRGAKVRINEKQISYAEDWPAHHWKSLKSAYANSPYFEYYAYELNQLYEEKPVSLLDFLKSCLEWSFTQLGVETHLEFTEEYQEASHYDTDFRTAIDPRNKVLPNWFYPHRYTQVFEGFELGLSILDLLFNLGPESTQFLRRSKRADSDL